MVDEFGHFLYNKGSSIHPLDVALLQNESYEKYQECKRIHARFFNAKRFLEQTHTSFILAT